MIHQLRKKVRFELWFLALLILVAIITFLGARWLTQALISSANKAKYNVSLSDEKSIYGSTLHDLGDDFSLLTKNQQSPLNGVPMEQNISRQQPIAIMIENYTPIRHTQLGLEDAAIVYEAPTEGGITRFLAVYDGQSVEEIGPVRSARPYFVTWASEYRAAYAHVGGSPVALANLRGNFRVLNIDEFADYVTIWRKKKYLAPHNAFTSIANITERLNGEKYYHPLTGSRFPFKEADETPGDIKTISIDFSIDPYKVKYEYDEDSNSYERFNGGKRHHDIKPTNIVVQFVETEVLDAIGRLRIQTHGAGKALVFRDGKVIEGTWEKDASINSSGQPVSQSWTKFFDKEGEEIELNRGQIWIEVVPNDRVVNYF